MRESPFCGTGAIGKQEIHMDKVGIIGGLRSYIGIENGMYKHTSAEQLGASVLRQVIDRYQLPLRDIDWIIAGNSVAAGGNPARLAMLEAGLPEEIPALTVDVQCGSGLEAIAIGAAKIESGLADVVIAGGMESCSTKPVRMRNRNHPDYVENQTGDKGGLSAGDVHSENVYHVAKFAPGRPDELAMLRGAENVAELWNMDIQRLNQYVITSHRRAAEAAENGELQNVIAAPCSSCDEGIRPGISERLLERLPVLVPGGRYVTAGTACLTHDGAAFVVLCSLDYARAHGLETAAVVEDVVSAGGIPERSPESIIPAIDKLLRRSCLTADRITAWECNEAFAVIDYLMEERFGQTGERLNIFGGALAYGHPYGASGGIITLHLLEALKKLDMPGQERHRYGVAAVAAAGGVGTAMLLRR